MKQLVTHLHLSHIESALECLWLFQPQHLMAKASGQVFQRQMCLSDVSSGMNIKEHWYSEHFVKWFCGWFVINPIPLLNGGLVRDVWCWDCLFLIFSGPRSVTSRAKAVAVIFVRVLVKSPKPETLRNLFQRKKKCSIIICLYVCDILWKVWCFVEIWFLDVLTLLISESGLWFSLLATFAAHDRPKLQPGTEQIHVKKSQAKSLSWISKEMLHNLDIARHCMSVAKSVLAREVQKDHPSLDIDL